MLQFLLKFMEKQSESWLFSDATSYFQVRPSRCHQASKLYSRRSTSSPELYWVFSNLCHIGAVRGKPLLNVQQAHPFQTPRGSEGGVLLVPSYSNRHPKMSVSEKNSLMSFWKFITSQQCKKSDINCPLIVFIVYNLWTIRIFCSLL